MWNWLINQSAVTLASYGWRLDRLGMCNVWAFPHQYVLHKCQLYLTWSWNWNLTFINYIHGSHTAREKHMIQSLFFYCELALKMLQHLDVVSLMKMMYPHRPSLKSDTALRIMHFQQFFFLKICQNMTLLWFVALVFGLLTLHPWRCKTCSVFCTLRISFWNKLWMNRYQIWSHIHYT